MLSKIWKQQKEYNEKIFKIEGGDEKHHWTRQYLLGLTAQVAEVLDGIKWKRNRNQENKKIIPLNILEEIVDIAKFTISLAQIWGFTEEEFLAAMYEKGDILDFKLKMEFKEPLVGKKILITDIDGTLADYHRSFLQWLEKEKNIIPDVNISRSLYMDTSLNMQYPEYYALKAEYESTGGYRNLIPYDDVHEFLQYAKKADWYIIAVTARPATTYKRIFKDTLHWFRENNLPIDELHMMGDERILLAKELAKDNEVILLEDDPQFLQRASNSGIDTIAREQLYNKLLRLPNIQIVRNFITVI